MSESSATAAVVALERCAEQLRMAVRQAPDAEASADDQLSAENAVAAGVAILAGEDAPVPATQTSGRATLAKDLLITVDLVLRSLQAHQP